MKRKLFLCIIAALFAANLQAQNKPQPLTQGDKKQAVESINKLLREEYIFPEVAEKTITTLAADLKNGNYAKIDDPNQFADILTHDLVSASNDKHFIVQFDPQWVKESSKTVTKKDSLDFANQQQLEFKQGNYGFEEAKILDGNIGYLNLIGFCPTSSAGETAVAAMNFLKNTDAIIIDLRNNNGGSSEMVQFLASYFFDETPQLFVEFYTRKGNETDRDYNLTYLPGERMPAKDLYILTSNHTFSAAEGFTYLMKNRKRATVIGETTGGGAHPVSREAVGDNFSIRIPVSKAIDPITKTDWEGTGIKPDFEVPLNETLETAETKALEKLANSTTDNKQYLWLIDGLKGRLHPTKVADEILKTYIGTYGQRKILYYNGDIYFQKAGGDKHKMIPIAQDLFLVDGIADVKIQIQTENGKVIAINRLYDDGDSRVDKRDE